MVRSKTIISLCLVSVFCFYSCGFGEWDITELYAQKIEGSSKVLYKYDAWGGRDSHVDGFLILDSTKLFKIDLHNNLPFLSLSDIPNKTIIEGVTHECYNSCGDKYDKSQPIFKPMKIEKTRSNNINIKAITYQYRGYSEKEKAFERYEFEKFVETKDSLFFYNLDDVESMNGIHLNELKVKKGEIYLQQSKKGVIEKIMAEQITTKPATKEIVEAITYSLTPKSKVLANAFSERGIFREVKIPK